MYYDSIASGYNELYGEEQQFKVLTAKQHMPFTIGSHELLLDVGCGTGISTDFWHTAFGCTTTGIDPSEQLIAQNTTHISEFLVGSAEKLPFQTDSFDVVVSFSAIGNFSDIEQGLKEIKRVGKQRFILSVMSRGEAFSLCKHLIRTQFRVVKEVIAKNDVIFFCE